MQAELRSQEKASLAREGAVVATLTDALQHAEALVEQERASLASLRATCAGLSAQLESARRLSAEVEARRLLEGDLVREAIAADQEATRDSVEGVMSAQSDARVASACRELRECALPPCPALPSPPLRARCSCLVMSREQGTRGKDAIASVEAAGQSRRVGLNAAVAPVRHCTSRPRSGAPNRGAVASGGRDRVVQSEQRWKAQHGPKRGRSPRRPPSAARPAVRHARLGRTSSETSRTLNLESQGRAEPRRAGRMRISYNI